MLGVGGRAVTRCWFPLLLVLPLLASCATRHAWQARDAGVAEVGGNKTARHCAAGNLDACATLIAALEAAEAMPPERQAAVYDLYLYSCELGDDDACQRIGYHYVYGSGANDDPLRAHAALVAACERGHGGSCHCAGSTLADGLIGPEDEPGAFELLNKGCEAGQRDCCSWVGLMYDFGRGVAQDKAQAFIYYTRGCEMGEHETGCFNVALHMSHLPEDQQDLPLMIELSQRSCDAGNEVGCGNVGVFREWANPVPTEPEASEPTEETP